MTRFASKRKEQEQTGATSEAIRKALGKRSIVMIGLMGCGKSSVGRRLATRLDLAFIDADDEIEAAAGKSISDIFAEHGEQEFRKGERRVIARLLAGGPQVLATGGGAFMDETTQRAIKENGLSVWLKADLELLMQRVRKRSHRPLLNAPDPEAIMRDLITERYPTYEQSDLTIESRDVSHEVVVEAIVAGLARKLVGAEST